MSTLQEHVAVSATIGTGILTFLRILPETLGCILSLCGIVWYIVQIRFAYLDRKEKRHRKISEVL